ncbi:MAG: DNA-processing protein DprA [Candidatus Methylacidiphilales bacterium]|nr:DNA-processing protein DprA [Candidatus Methylacidiphilales bacterium]
MTRTECYLALNSVRLIGPVRVRRLLESLGSVEAILSAPASRLAAVDGVGPEAARAITEWEKNWDLAGELAAIARLGLRVIDQEDPAYPALLKEIYDPPLVLYYRGDLTACNRRPIAVVGSRHTSHYGQEMAKKLAYQIAYAGLTVTSGLARGIDTFAHQGALAAKGRTVAVLGCSLDQVYPPENRALADMIAEQGGALLSEFPLGTPPDRQTFPMRNRIVSGLSTGLVVVEAGEASGALITARMALDQGRNVFAVPGRIDQPHAKGCHRLIKEGAKLVEGVEDILNESGLLLPPGPDEGKRPWPEDLTPAERKILEAMDLDEIALDALIQKCGLPSAVVTPTLLRLEMRKLVRQLPGKTFVKTD